MWWTPTPEETGEIAKVAAGSWLGGATMGLFRRNRPMMERVIMAMVSAGMGLLFAWEVGARLGIPATAAAYGVAAGGLAVAFGVMKAIDRFDFAVVVNAVLGSKRDGT